MWKSLKDEFPPVKDEGCGLETGNILIFDGRTVYIGYANRQEDEDDWRWYLQGRDGYRIDGVTHWMELPASPK